MKALLRTFPRTSFLIFLFQAHHFLPPTQRYLVASLAKQELNINHTTSNINYHHPYKPITDLVSHLPLTLNLARADLMCEDSINMSKHFSLLGRSRSNLSQLANIRRMYRLKASIKQHINEIEDLVCGFGSLPLFLRDEYLVGAVDRALDNSLALEHRVQGWKLEEGKVVEEKVIVDAEKYFKKCSLVVKDIGEAIRALRALVPEQEKGEDNEENGAEQGEEEEEIDEDV